MRHLPQLTFVISSGVSPVNEKITGLARTPKQIRPEHRNTGVVLMGDAVRFLGFRSRDLSENKLLFWCIKSHRMSLPKPPFHYLHIHQTYR